MIRLFKKKIESSLFTLTELGLHNSSNLTRPVLDSTHTQLVIKRFQRRYPKAPRHIPIDKEYSKEVQAYWKNLLGITITPAWHHIIKSINGHEDPRYITPKIWADQIQWKLNPPKYHDPLIVDKNALDFYIDKSCLPKTVLKIIDGGFFDSDHKKISLENAKKLLVKDEQDKFVKPSRLYQGLGAFKIHVNRGKIFIGESEISFQEFIKKTDDNAIIQYIVDQHPKIASVHPHSLNTLRMKTIRIGTEIHFIGGSIKFGADKNVADNTGNGILCGIKDDHKLMDIGYNRQLQIFTEHHNSGVKFKDFGEIPSYQSAIDLCKEIHKTLLFHDFAAWDIAIQKDGTPLIVELNAKPTMLTWQIRMTQPLFRDLTEEAWNYISKK